MKEIGLYVHIPFCSSKCNYCDFPSFSGMEKYMDEYIQALELEIKSKCSNVLIRSLFIGGGTPSYLNKHALKKLMEILKTLNFKDGCEKTIECNPGTLTKEKLQIIKEGGINRLSFGLQSTKDNLLKRIGRIHSFKQFKDNYFLARDLGFNNINVDMMFGLPNQTLDDYINSLKEVIHLNVDHISAYSLIIEEGTCFFNDYENGLLILPSEEEERDMYVKGKELLQNKGYYQYEISNFAKENKECFHNKIYWKTEEYIGVGSSSSSYINNKRIKNTNNIKEYIKNEDVTEEIYVNSLKDSMEEFMFMGLRMNSGVSEEEFKERFNKDIDEIYKVAIHGNINKGLILREGGRIKLTEKGIELSNLVMSDMIL